MITLSAQGQSTLFGGIVVTGIFATKYVECPKELAGNWCWEFWKELNLTVGEITCEEGELVRGRNDSRPTWKSYAPT